MQMNRARISLLIAAAAISGMPALASAQEPDNRGRQTDRGSDRGERGAPPPVQDRRTRAPPAPRPEQQQRPQQQQQQPPQQQQQRPAPGQGYGERRPDGGNRGGQRWSPQQQQQAQQSPVQQQQRPQGDPGRGFNGGGNRQGDDRRGGQDRGNFQRNDGNRGDDRRDFRGNDGRNGYGNNNGQAWRGGQQPGRDYGRPGYNNNNGRPQWRNDWRGDRRYDWRGYRDQNRGRFHAQRYVPPRGFGWGYRSFSIGYQLDRFFYAPSYWVNDPWEYRLPPVYGPYRWVRYYNDVLLVDIDTGEVVDVIQNFFW
jgi:hypothetical protein